MLYNSLLDAIGNTPLIKVNAATPGQLFAKLEYLNPGGSVKDRSALFMIEKAEKKGLIKAGGTLIDASSGNQGIATAMIGVLKGYKVIICVSEKVSQEKYNTIKAYGAQVVMCPATDFLEDPESYHSTAMRLNQEIPNSFMPNQYFNLANAQAHYTLLGPEIWRQTEGKITHFFAGAGTGGTITGAGKFLKEKNPTIKVLAMDSDTSWRTTCGHPKPYKVEGMGIDFNSPVFDPNITDEVIPVSDTNALSMTKELAHRHGLLAGPSSGAVAWAAHDYAQKNFRDGDLGVMIFGDSGRAYLSKGFYVTDETNEQMQPPKVSSNVAQTDLA